MRKRERRSRTLTVIRVFNLSSLLENILVRAHPIPPYNVTIRAAVNFTRPITSRISNTFIQLNLCFTSRISLGDSRTFSMASLLSQHLTLIKEACYPSFYFFFFIIINSTIYPNLPPTSTANPFTALITWLSLSLQPNSRLSSLPTYACSSPGVGIIPSGGYAIVNPMIRARKLVS